MYKSKHDNELSHEEVSRRAKAWSIGNNILIQMQRANHHEWDIKKEPKQVKLNLDEEY